MKRFTETQKWADPWYRKLPPSAKLLWQWLTDNCDGAGVIEPDFDLATFQIGLPMGIDTLLELGDRVEKLKCGKYFIPKFIGFQYGQLSDDCKAHNPVFISLEKHGLKGYPKGFHTHQEKEKEKEKDSVNGITAEQIYDEYPLKVGKPAALRAISKAMQRTEPARLLEITKAFAIRRAGDKSFLAHPATWYNDERYNDDPSTWTRAENNPGANGQRVDRSIGTSNEGLAGQYANLGRLAKTPDPQRPGS